MLLSFFISPGYIEPIRQPKADLLLVFAGLYLAYLFGKHIAKPIGWFFGYIIFNAYFSGFGVFQVTETVCIAATLALSTLVVESDAEALRKFLHLALLGMVINCIYSYVQMSGHDFIFLYHKIEQQRIPVGFMGQHTLLGPYLAMGFTIALILRYFWVSLLFIPPLFVINSSCTFAATAAGFFVFILHRFGRQNGAWFLAPAIPVLGLAAWFKPDLIDSQGRVEVWTSVFKHLLEHPVFGYGVGTYKHYVGQIQTGGSMQLNGVFQEVHNDFLQFLFDGGFVGGAILVFVVLYLVNRALKNFHVPEVAALLGVFAVAVANSIGNFPFLLVPQGPIAVISLIASATLKEGAYGRID